jgi:membrane protein implicated in regulation of membrane protease activity
MSSSFFGQLGAWNWLIIAALFGALEIIVPGYLLIWYGLAALFVGVIALAVDLTWQIQLLLFAGIGMVLLYLSLRLARQKAPDTDRPHLNERGAQHIGKIYTLVDDTANGRGKLKVGDSLWSVRLEEGDLPAGAGVEITAVDGITLIGKAS